MMCEKKGSLGEGFFDYSAGVPRDGVEKTKVGMKNCTFLAQAVTQFSHSAASEFLSGAGPIVKWLRLFVIYHGCREATILSSWSTIGAT